MLFLLATDIPVVSEPARNQTLPSDLMNYQAPPVLLEGSVENFDPVARAAKLAKDMPRKWCGTFKSFERGPNLEAILTLEKVTPIGQMVDLRGHLQLGAFRTPIQGNLNAKSDQLELLTLSDQLMPGIESGGSFMGLQGTQLSGWNSPRFTNRGGRLELTKNCETNLSEAPPISGLW